MALSDDVVQEGVGVGVDVGRGPPWFGRNRADDRGSAHRNGTGVERAVDGAGSGAVRREIDLCAGGGTGDADGERHFVETAVDAELGVRHEAQRTAAVDAAGRRLCEVTFRTRSERDAGEFG